MKSKALRIAVMLLLVMTSACSVKQFPAGVYKPAQLSPTDSIVEFKFTEDGTFAISYYDGRKAGGMYTVSDDHITFNESEDGPCFGSPVVMAWTSNGNNLTLKSVEDTCRYSPSFDWARVWSREQ